jgi:hypothetical protein
MYWWVSNFASFLSNVALAVILASMAGEKEKQESKPPKKLHTGGDEEPKRVTEFVDGSTEELSDMTYTYLGSKMIDSVSQHRMQINQMKYLLQSEKDTSVNADMDYMDAAEEVFNFNDDGHRERATSVVAEMMSKKEEDMTTAIWSQFVRNRSHREDRERSQSMHKRPADAAERKLSD